MSKTKKTKNNTEAKQAEQARKWEIHFGFSHGTILTRQQLLAQAPDIWLSAEQEDGFTDERTLPHGLYFLKVQDALKVCLQTGHPDTHDSMIVGWYWDSFTEEEIAEGTFSTPEWDEIEEGESLFDMDDELHEPDGFPCFNGIIFERFESHSRQGYLGFSPAGNAPEHDLATELQALKKWTLDLADPFEGFKQDDTDIQWEIHFGVRRVQQLLAGLIIKKA